MADEGPGFALEVAPGGVLGQALEDQECALLPPPGEPVPSDGLTRTLFLDRVERLAAALRLVSLAYAKALGRLLERPPAPVVH